MAGTPETYSLRLPLPPSINAMGSMHPIYRGTTKRRYQRSAWTHAVSQLQPLRDPPEHVTVSAHFRVHNLRDEDNLTGGLKWVLDALRQNQTGSLEWRQGVYDRCGYFVDDDPKHLSLGSVTQELLRSDKGVTLTIEVTQ